IVALQDKHLFLHPHEGNEFVKKNFVGYHVTEVDGKLFVMDPYKKDHPGVHNDPTITRNGTPFRQLFDMNPIKIPENEYFMMGDNRDHSNDSRFWGTVPYKFIVGTPWFIYFSWDKNYEVRWNRVFRTVGSIEKEMEGKKLEINHEKGIY
ncbi:signal peptidase I, partial [Arcobacter sp.]|uniref:signal peptidase I n=1 Tax=Arcobacter sp. TaxID=1872629 RepID=UPI003D0ED69B